MVFLLVLTVMPTPQQHLWNLTKNYFWFITHDHLSRTTLFRPTIFLNNGRVSSSRFLHLHFISYSRILLVYYANAVIWLAWAISVLWLGVLNKLKCFLCLFLRTFESTFANKLDIQIPEKTKSRASTVSWIFERNWWARIPNCKCQVRSNSVSANFLKCDV